MNTPASGPLRLRVVTREVATIDDVLGYASPAHPTVWSRRGDILVGVGEAAAFTALDDTTEQIGSWWRQIVAGSEIDDTVGLPGTGLIAFGALPFDARSESAAAFAVPSVIIGRRGTRSWVTHVTAVGDRRDPSDDSPDHVGAELPDAQAYGPHWAASVGPGRLTPDGYQSAVQRGIDAIRAGEVEKVVLARDLVGTVPPDADLRRLVRALSSAYPDTWTFAVDGLIGASPETLVTVSGGTVTARVLAGTIARGADADADTAASLALATSTKDNDEHGYAVRSVLEALRPFTSSLAAGEQPFMLKLPNVWHLASDVEGELSAQASALDLVGALHPTAAVAGTPTAAALDVIRRLEPFDRGRYAGPVGWIDANGDGEWAIALRCAQFATGSGGSADAGGAGGLASAGGSADANGATDAGGSADAGGTGIRFTAYAGAGIVSASDPESEMLETRVKFRPIVDALA